MYTFNKPLAGMKTSQTEVNRMIREQNNAIYEEDEQKRKLQESVNQLESEQYYEYVKGIRESVTKNSVNRSSFLKNVRTSFMTECLYKLYKDSSVAPLTESDRIIAKNLINKFVLEKGAKELISEFATKNLLLSEFSRITQKYYDMVLETCDEKNKEVEFTISNDVTNDFYKELETVDTDTASKLIRDRVSDAISEFIDDNVNQKIEYQDIISAAQDKIATATDESMIEVYSNRAKRKINEMKLSRNKNVFHCLVESLSKNAITDPSLKQKYLIDESKLDMEGIVNDSQLIYTMLEMINTTNMVNEEYVSNYIKSFA